MSKKYITNTVKSGNVLTSATKVSFRQIYIKKCALSVMLVVLSLTTSSAFAESLATENARLKAELAQLKKVCDSGQPGNPGQGQKGEVRVGDLGFTVVSLRTSRINYVYVYSTVRVVNYGKQSIALNYISQSYSIVDNLGYKYEIDGAKAVKGISKANAHTASVNDIVLPGDAISISFEAKRMPKDGQTVGQKFDIGLTLASFEDLGEGRIRKIRTYPVAFVGVPRN